MPIARVATSGRPLALHRRDRHPVPEACLTPVSSRARYAEPSAGCDQPRRTGMRKPQLMTPAARAQLMATACDALQQALCKVYDLRCDQNGLPHLSADEQ